MPEGDTLFRTARTLARRLEGRTLLRCTSPVEAIARRSDLVGRTVTRVVAYGKYVLIHLGPPPVATSSLLAGAEGAAASGRLHEDTLVLRTHLRMNGSWHVYRPGEAFQLPAWRARLQLEVEGSVAVCFSAPVVELVSSRAAGADLEQLGPDLLATDFDLDAALVRLVRFDGPVGVAVMDQRVVAGIGNVYKSEVLYIERVDPFAQVKTLTATKLRAVLATARALLQANAAAGAGRRRTRKGPGPAHWVYERSGSPCLTCGTLVKMRRQGALARSTYYCPRCQAVTTFVAV